MWSKRERKKGNKNRERREKEWKEKIDNKGKSKINHI